MPPPFLHADGHAANFETITAYIGIELPSLRIVPYHAIPQTLSYVEPSVVVHQLVFPTPNRSFAPGCLPFYIITTSLRDTLLK